MNMVFNSIDFLIFCLVFYPIFLLWPSKTKWAWLLISSWFFYFTFKPEYLLILIGLTAVDFFCGKGIVISDGRPKTFFLIFSLAANIGTLVVFKYLGLFGQLWEAASGSNPFAALLFTVPIGISFHTFQGMAYVIDLYRGKIIPERNFGIFALFIGIFPQLMAGPIERAQHLIPQLTRRFSLAAIPFREALLLILAGYIKKLVIADSLGVVVDPIYQNPQNFNGLTLIVATVFFGFQLYCDFSGYIDIARGLGKLLGIDFVSNFKKPYFSANITEFWRRWHISLSEWVRDYLYISLGGNRFGKLRQYLNLVITMAIMGLWHGSSFQFALWGFYHGLLLVFHKIFSTVKIKTPTVVGIILTFISVNLGWVFFRSQNAGQAWLILKTIFGPSLAHPLQYQLGMVFGAILIVTLVILEALDLKWRLKDKIISVHSLAFGAICAILFHFLVLFGAHQPIQFIYFQF